VVLSDVVANRVDNFCKRLGDASLTHCIPDMRLEIYWRLTVKIHKARQRFPVYWDAVKSKVKLDQMLSYHRL
jgi:hypothetical protein